MKRSRLFLRYCLALPLGLAAFSTWAQVASPDTLYGDLFHAVQTGRVFPDSKTFPDCTPVREPEAILEAYRQEKGAAGFELKAFVLGNFYEPESQATGFESDRSRPIEQHIDTLWDVLTRPPGGTYAQTSLLPLPKEYVVPGGRFREIYYWDSYFTMLGLRASGRWDLIEGMVANFAHLIDEYGHIPNGNRSYYLSRSQPPFFSLMVELLAEKDTAALARYLPQLEKEYAFWMDGEEALTVSKHEHRRVAKALAFTLNRYYDDRAAPRPESYREDVELAEASGRDPESLYRDLRAACESGWDFSSRWLEDPDDLSSIRTTETLPVDLNCLLWHLESTLARAYERSGEGSASRRLRRKAVLRRMHILHFFWEEREGFFFDYLFRENEQTGVYTLAGVFPLFFGLASPSQAKRVAEVLEERFLSEHGLLTTLTETGQQWDAPNGWAPLHWVAIEGLRRYGHDGLADEIERRWTARCREVYRQTGKLVEKYELTGSDRPAGGGEYPLQDGFGWTNGVYRALTADD